IEVVDDDAVGASGNQFILSIPVNVGALDCLVDLKTASGLNGLVVDRLIEGGAVSPDRQLQGLQGRSDAAPSNRQRPSTWQGAQAGQGLSRSRIGKKAAQCQARHAAASPAQQVTSRQFPVRLHFQALPLQFGILRIVFHRSVPFVRAKASDLRAAESQNERYCRVGWFLCSYTNNNMPQEEHAPFARYFPT